jgi:hypothetical protein
MIINIWKFLFSKFCFKSLKSNVLSFSYGFIGIIYTVWMHDFCQIYVLLIFPQTLFLAFSLSLMVSF